MTTAATDTRESLKWLMFFRVLFTLTLLCSTVILQLGRSPSPLERPLLILYALITAVFIVSCIYAYFLDRVPYTEPLAYVQALIDTVMASLLVYITGGFSSAFSFLYLVVIIYTSMLLFRRGSLVVALLSSLQYALLVGLEFFGTLTPFVMEDWVTADQHSWSHVVLKVFITVAACFAVAYLSGLLAEQVRKTRYELQEMENHMRRVQKLAYMGEMAAGMAHEIKNPLASLAGAIQLLREDLAYHPQHERLMQIVLRETDRLSTLVGHFLLFSRPMPGKPLPIDLAAVLGETVALFEKDRLCQRRIDVDCQLSPNVWVMMDPAHLRQVMWNLLLNAAEAIAAKGRILVETVVEKNDTVLVRVADGGCGIAPEAISLIFDPFYTTKPNGTGLGLSIVHSLIQAYNSHLQVSSLPGKETVFSFRINRINPPST